MLVILQLESNKPYDNITWDLIFKFKLKLSMPETFVDMVRILFGDASASVSEQR